MLIYTIVMMTTFIPIEVILVGMVIDFNKAQFEKALVPEIIMMIIILSMFMIVIPIVVTLVGIDIALSLVPEKA